MKPSHARFVTVVLFSVGLVAGCTPVSQPGPDASSPDSGSPDSQERYTYPGCDDAGTNPGAGCPRELVFVCALNSIREKYVSCASAADCVAVSATNCIDYFTTCLPAAVNNAGSAAFLEEASAQGDRYCGGGGCRGFGHCAFSYRRRLVDCISGRCVALQDDGGIF